jgi:hypothetical protein
VGDGARRAAPLRRDDMSGGLRFRETEPHVALRPWIRSYYHLASPRGARAATEGQLVPDGHLELGFNLGGRVQRLVAARLSPDATQFRLVQRCYEDVWGFVVEIRTAQIEGCPTHNCAG